MPADENYAYKTKLFWKPIIILSFAEKCEKLGTQLYIPMNSHEIEQKVKRVIENFSKENFLYDLLLAYGISKTSITRLKSGDFNLSKVDEEILYKKKIFFKQLPADKLLMS